MVNKFKICAALCCFLVVLIGCERQESGSERQESGTDSIQLIITKLQSSIKSANRGEIKKLFLPNKKLFAVDWAVIMTPSSGGELIDSKFLPVSEAREQWVNLPQMIQGRSNGYAVRLFWHFPSEHGVATIEQFYYVVEINGRFYID